MKDLTKLTKDEILTLNNALQITKSRYEKERNDCVIANIDTAWYDNALEEIKKADEKLEKIFFEL